MAQHGAAQGQLATGCVRGQQRRSKAGRNAGAHAAPSTVAGDSVVECSKAAVLRCSKGAGVDLCCAVLLRGFVFLLLPHGAAAYAGAAMRLLRSALGSASGRRSCTVVVPLPFLLFLSAFWAIVWFSKCVFAKVGRQKVTWMTAGQQGAFTRGVPDTVAISGPSMAGAAC